MNEVDVSHRKRLITMSIDGKRRTISCYGYPDVVVYSKEEAEQELEKLYEKERVRLSYKKGV